MIIDINEQILDYLKQLEDRVSKLEDNNLILQLEKNIKQFINEAVPIITEYNNNLINLTIQLEVLKYHISTTNNMDYKQMFIDYQLLLTYMKQNNLSLQELIQMMNDKLKGESINTYFSIKNISDKNSIKKDSIKEDSIKNNDYSKNDSSENDLINKNSFENDSSEKNLIKENNDISNIEKNLAEEEFINKSMLNQQEENLHINNEIVKEEKITRTKKRSIKDVLKEKKQKLIQQTQDLILAENNILQTNENKQANSEKTMKEQIDNPIEAITINNQLELTEKVTEKKDAYEYEITKTKNKKVIIDDDGSEWISL